MGKALGVGVTCGCAESRSTAGVKLYLEFYPGMFGGFFFSQDTSMQPLGSFSALRLGVF